MQHELASLMFSHCTIGSFVGIRCLFLSFFNKIILQIASLTKPRLFDELRIRPFSLILGLAACGRSVVMFSQEDITGSSKMVHSSEPGTERTLTLVT